MRHFLKILLLVCSALAILACSITFNLTDSPVAELPPKVEPPRIEPPTVSPPTPTPCQTITVYFTDQNRFAVGADPFEVAVHRPLRVGADPMRAVLDAYFDGPTAQESAQGLVLIASGFTGVGEMTVVNGIARIYLLGKCANNGAAYSVASLIHKNLEQFPQITAVKIYDENGDTLDPDSSMGSLPYCLEP